MQTLPLQRRHLHIAVHKASFGVRKAALTAYEVEYIFHLSDNLSMIKSVFAIFHALGKR
jgi:hypothetical protein